MLIGRLVRTPELRDVKVNGKDTSITKNAIAVRRPFKNANGEYESDFFDFTLWGASAEFLVNYADKGTNVVLKGRIQNRKYQDQAGNDKIVTEIIAEGIEILSAPKEKKPVQEEKKPTPQDFNFNNVDSKVSDSDLPF